MTTTNLAGGILDVGAGGGTYTMTTTFNLSSGTLRLHRRASRQQRQVQLHRRTGGRRVLPALQQRTLIYSNAGAGTLGVEVQNHGTMVFNNDGTFGSITNFASITVPAGRMINTATNSFMSVVCGTLTQLANVVTRDLHVSGLWDQHSGSLSIADGVVGSFNSTGTLILGGGTFTVSSASGIVVGDPSGSGTCRSRFLGLGLELLLTSRAGDGALADRQRLWSAA